MILSLVVLVLVLYQCVVAWIYVLHPLFIQLEVSWLLKFSLGYLKCEGGRLVE